MADVYLYPSNFGEVANVLFDLADDINHVATDTSNGFGLRIPEYLYDRWLRFQALDDLPVDDEASEPAAKKRGRPRKIALTSPDEEI